MERVRGEDRQSGRETDGEIERGRQVESSGERERDRWRELEANREWQRKREMERVRWRVKMERVRQGE